MISGRSLIQSEEKRRGTDFTTIVTSGGVALMLNAFVVEEPLLYRWGNPTQDTILLLDLPNVY